MSDRYLGLILFWFTINSLVTSAGVTLAVFLSH